MTVDFREAMKQKLWNTQLPFNKSIYWNFALAYSTFVCPYVHARFPEGIIPCNKSISSTIYEPAEVQPRNDKENVAFHRGYEIYIPVCTMTQNENRRLNIQITIGPYTNHKEK